MNKTEARASVWKQLRRVARPDSRFHFDFNKYIPDFEGSRAATERLMGMDIFRNAHTLFITPDNCLEILRAETARAGKTQIVSTYGIRRGLVELKPADAPPGLETYAVMLDALEGFGRYLSLAELRRRGRLDLIVTGASAVNTAGVRFGKGHGFFDLEWAMLYQLGVADEQTPIVAFVHDCQVVELELTASPFDTLCDIIITPTRVLEVANPQKPTVGVVWDRLEAGMMDDIPPLRELKQLEEGRALTR